MKSITIRGIDDRLQKELENVSAREQKNLNKIILSLLRKALGIEEKVKYPSYDDLDHLAGTWSEQDEIGFNKAASAFSQIETGIRE